MIKYPQMADRKYIKSILAVLIPASVCFVCLYVYRYGSKVPCVFHEITGLYCPGCGSGRAVYSALHGHIKEAFQYNVMLFILGIPATLVLIYEYVRLFISRKKLPPVVVPRKVAIALTVVVFLFFVARNIPAFAFLAP